MSLAVLSSLFERLGCGQTPTDGFVSFPPRQDIIGSPPDGLGLPLETDIEKLFIDRAPPHRAEGAELLEEG